jgi:NAD(P)-dependent dehydrogenase (short-subunit alcohol dehydrogenase family)
MKVFSGRIAVVTGGASGIGYGMVQNFLKLGMKVVIVDFNRGYLEEAGIALAGRKDVHFIEADVGDQILDVAFPRNQQVPPGRGGFEDDRRAMVNQLRALPVKD